MERAEAKNKNIKFYNTGRPCKYGHLAPRRTINGRCEVCVKLTKPTYDRAYRLAHLAKLKLKDAIRANQKNKNYRATHPEAVKANKARYYAKYKGKILEKCKQYRAAKKAELAEYFKKYKQTNKELVNAVNAKRRASKLNRTPAWLTADDLWIIKEIYALAKARTKLHGFAWHVDHIYPLNGKEVSGLHVPYNLQVIPAIENLRKSNG